MPFSSGENVGPYRILEQLGQGGMATVYRAYHAALDRYVAIKVLHPAFLQEANFLARFQREARVVARLEHPNIVPVYDFAEHQGQPYLVMKFIDGETLKARLGRGPLDTAETLAVMEAVGAGLAYAHDQGILHRDIKPSNVILATDGRIYLADFGLARIAGAGESTISTDSTLGTPHYISPEQALGRVDLDAGTDIYSLGVMLYELLVGRVPFNADTPFSIIHDHIYTPLPLPSHIDPEFPAHLEAVLLKALAKDRNDRFAGISELVAAFQKALADTTRPPVVESLPESEATVVAKQTPTPVIPPASQTAPKAIRAPKSDTLRWLLAGGMILLVGILCAAGGLLVLRNLRNQAAASAQSSRMDELKRAVEQNPSDANAHLDLALAYWDAGMKHEAQTQFDRMVRFAGDDYAIYHRAGDQLMEREAWYEAARSYLLALRTAPVLQAREILPPLAQALYLAAPDTRIPGMLDEARSLERWNGPIEDVIRARNLLFSGDPEKAMQMVDEIRSRPVKIIETELLAGEILLAQGQTERARAQFQAVIDHPDASEWARAVAKHFLESISITPQP